jgi:2-C-methyl-D-erythritol 4-phosphate cytidylyltransferase / 2-C-methyl-D-erythritol 2,4-cyclodiphosphate synthase
MFVSAIIAAGGRGRRLAAAGVPKQLLEIGGRSLLQRSVEAFLDCDRVHEIVVVVPSKLAEAPPPYLGGAAKPLRVVVGGERRQDSVANGFAAVSDHADLIVVHDAARPFVTEALIVATIDAACESGAAIAALSARDTVKLARTDAEASRKGDRSPEGARWVSRTLARELVFLAQTPQAFRREVLRDAIAMGQRGANATDEAALAELAGHFVRLVEGDPRNIKITTAEDLALARGGLMEEASAHRAGESPAGLSLAMRIGAGYDLHRLVPGRPLLLGGVTLPFPLGLAGHSDADVLSHAVIDAILGAAGAGDIGRHFPDTDERWKGASSLDLLRRATAVVRKAGFEVENVDAVVIAEQPRLVPFLPAITGRLAEALGIEEARVSVKGKTNEGVGEIGRGEAIAVHAVALLRVAGGRR